MGELRGTVRRMGIQGSRLFATVALDDGRVWDGDVAAGSYTKAGDVVAFDPGDVKPALSIIEFGRDGQVRRDWLAEHAPEALVRVGRG